MRYENHEKALNGLNGFTLSISTLKKEVYYFRNGCAVQQFGDLS
jgi:hypothetical protein